ncbi:MAG: hypothetical protein Roseis2KO_32750 [Roseivirga sp.]
MGKVVLLKNSSLRLRSDLRWLEIRELRFDSNSMIVYSPYPMSIKMAAWLGWKAYAIAIKTGQNVKK